MKSFVSCARYYYNIKYDYYLLLIIFCQDWFSKGSGRALRELWDSSGRGQGELSQSSPSPFGETLLEEKVSQRSPRALPKLRQSSPGQIFFQPKVPKVWNSYFLKFFWKIYMGISKYFKNILKLFWKCFKVFLKDYNGNYQIF